MQDKAAPSEDVRDDEAILEELRDSPEFQRLKDTYFKLGRDSAEREIAEAIRRKGHWTVANWILTGGYKR